MSFHLFVEFLLQKIVQTNCEKLETILSTCRPRLRTAEADASTQKGRSPAPVVVALLHSSPSFHSSLRPCKFLLYGLSLSLSFRCPGLGVLYSLVQLIHASKDLLHVRHSSTPSAPSALTTASRCRSHDQTHQSLHRPLPLSFDNSSAVDRMRCLFQAHGLNENSL